jgi:hypothetical protein
MDAGGDVAYLTVTRWLDDGLSTPARDMAGKLIEKADNHKYFNKNGLVILDVSDFNAHRPDPKARVLSTLFWDDTHYAEYAIPFSAGHKSYVVFTDLIGAIGAGILGGAATNEVPRHACATGRPGHGIARIIDVSDKSHPLLVSKLTLEVAAPSNCEKVKYDPARGYKYGVEGCAVDDPVDARLLACGHVEAGLRVFDIRDPSQPHEVAYYKPAAAGKRTTPAAPLFPAAVTQGGAESFESTADQVIQPYFHGHGKDLQIWFNSTDNGFQIVRFSSHFQEKYGDLLSER